MKQFTTLFFIFHCFMFAWKAEQFPVDKVEITSTFGESRGDHFHSGIDFGYVQAVKPVAKGEVLFYKDFNENPTMPSFGSGDFVVVGHNDDIRTYYFHLQEKSINRELSSVEKSDILGTIGSSGRSTGAHLHFMVEDIENNKILNPLSIFPSIEDTIKPRIASFYLLINEKIVSFRRPNPVLRYRGKMGFFIFGHDMRKVWTPRGMVYVPIGAKRISIKIDNKVMRDYDFNYLIKSEDGLYVFPNYSHEEVYGVPYNYKVGDFAPSRLQHRIEILVEDQVGNRSTKEFVATFK